ncbi:zinc ribbon domain-containing protein [candidate division GN15 bacterium]|nr:zinc ribbon domain-containing protein [candidate division GN15 bacterium]
MPIFEYQCEDCGYKFERLVPRADSTAACPSCQSERTKKLLSMFASSSGNSGSSAPSCGGRGFS